MRRVEDQRAKTERLRAGGGLILIESPYIKESDQSLGTSRSRSFRPSLSSFSTHSLSLFFLRIHRLDRFRMSKERFCRAEATSMMDFEIDFSAASACLGKRTFPVMS